MYRNFTSPVPRGSAHPVTSVTSWTKDVESRVHHQAMSTKILGLGLFLVGVLILSVALIIGLEFPKYVRTKIIEDQCILNKNHDKFDSWRFGAQWNRVNRLYFWVLQNKGGFLYNGEQPVLTQKGPYVYVEHIEKTDITFNMIEVWFRMRRTNTFDADATSAECGPDCTKQDQLTLLNPDYLRKSSQTSSEKDYIHSVISVILSKSMSNIGVRISDNVTDKIEALGCLNSVCDTNWSGQVLSTNSLADLSFGAWLQRNETSYKSVILSHMGDTNFLKSSMIGLYSMLTKPSLLKYENSSFKEDCLSWAKNIGCASSSSGLTVSASQCGVIPLLEVFSQGSVTCLKNFSVQVQTFLCNDVSAGGCFTLPEPLETLTAYIEALTAFVLSHISNFVQEIVTVNQRHGLVTTRNQSELALGYQEEDAAGVSRFVPGVFSDQWSPLGSEQSLSPKWTQATCLQNRNTANNMMIKKINGSQFVPKVLTKDTNMNVYISGHTDFVASCSQLQACVTCQPPASSLKIYIPELWRDAFFTDPTSSTIHNSHLYTYRLSKNAFTDGAVLLEDGIQDMSGMYGYSAWWSNPYYYHTSGNHSVELITGAQLDKHVSQLSVEVDTGRVWQTKYRLQFSVGIKQENINAHRAKPLNVTYLEQPIPLYWIERRTDITQKELDYFNYKVGRLMGVSCGGLIGVSVLAVIVMIISVVACLLPPKANRVAPVPDDGSLVNPRR